MSKVFIDTNVLLDLLGERVPFYEPAAKIVTQADMGEITLFASSLSYATTYYILSKYENENTVRNKLKMFRTISKISDLSATVVEKALQSKFDDFEDALQYYCAIQADCKVLITRNGKYFKFSNIPVMTPTEYIKSLFFKN